MVNLCGYIRCLLIESDLGNYFANQSNICTHAHNVCFPQNTPSDSLYHLPDPEMAAVRPIVSYDDITLPYDGPSEITPQSPPQIQPRPLVNNPSSKKRKNTNKQKQNSNESQLKKRKEHNYESRELTRDEIWDDRALIEAWEAATEEYEVLNGPDKAWKNEPVHKSSLYVLSLPPYPTRHRTFTSDRSWYNVPPKDKAASVPPVFTNTPANDEEEGETKDNDNSRPFDFSTFVPDYDPTLPTPVPMTADFGVAGVGVTPNGTQPGDPMAHVDQDEAFRRALGAMYWGGYWTAAYQVCFNAFPTSSCLLINLLSTIGVLQLDKVLSPSTKRKLLMMTSQMAK